MKVIVGQRGTGRTEKLVQWLLKGFVLEEYPGWSRAIVCPTSRDAVNVTQRVYVASRKFEPESGYIHILGDRELADLRKAVWGGDDLVGILRGRNLASVEYAVDDFDRFDPSSWDVFRFVKRPAIIVIEGEVYEDDPA